jgi:hypothetical protein
VDFVDRLLTVFALDHPAAERGNANGGVPIDLARAAFLSLLRAGVAIEPRWDEFLPLEMWMPADERARCVRAIPEERRDAAVANALRRIFFNGARVTVALELLPAFPLASAAAAVVANIQDARDANQALDVLRSIGAEHPAVAAVAKPLEAKLARCPRLRAAERIDPITREDLDATRSKQLEAASRKYGGKKLTVAQIFDTPEDQGAERIMPRHTRLVLLEDEKGKRVYDAWLYMGDTGCIFKAGTTTTVAEIIQGSLECKSLPLKLALKAALDDKPLPAPVTRPAEKRGR